MLALIADLIIFQLALTLLFLLITLLTPLKLDTSLYQHSVCVPMMSGPLVDKMEMLWPLQKDERRINTICHGGGLSSTSHDIFTTKVIRTTGTTTFSRSASTPVDARGNASTEGFLPQTIASWIGIMLFPIALACFSIGCRRSPGKKAASLRIVTRDDNGCTPAQALMRETLKFLPILALVCLRLILLAVQPEFYGNFDAMLITVRDGTFQLIGWIFPVAWAFAFATAVWWLAPFVVWRQQTFYDRLAGCKVIAT